MLPNRLYDTKNKAKIKKNKGKGGEGGFVFFDRTNEAPSPSGK